MTKVSGYLCSWSEHARLHFIVTNKYYYSNYKISNEIEEITLKHERAHRSPLVSRVLFTLHARACTIVYIFYVHYSRCTEVSVERTPYTISRFSEYRRSFCQKPSFVWEDFRKSNRNVKDQPWDMV